MLSTQKSFPVTAVAPLTSCRSYKPARRSECAPALAGTTAMGGSKLLLPGMGSYRSKTSMNENTSRRNIAQAPDAAASAAAPVAAAVAPGARLLVALASIYVIPFFGMMIFAPKSKKTRQTMESFGLFVPLALMYAYLLVKSWQPDTLSLMMPGDLSQGLSGLTPQFFPKLEGVANLFSRPTTAASLWIHIITINLFFAKVCYIKGLAAKLPTAHTIIIAACFGPLAILSTVATQMAVGTVGCFSRNKPLAERIKDQESANAAKVESTMDQAKETSIPSASAASETTRQSLAESSKVARQTAVKTTSGNGMPAKSQDLSAGSDSKKAPPLQPTAPEVSKPPVISGAVEAKDQMGVPDPRKVLSKESPEPTEIVKEALSSEMKKSDSPNVFEKPKLKVEVPKPAVEVPKPTTEVPKPEVKAPKPTTEVSKPSMEQLKPLDEPVKPLPPSPQSKREDETVPAALSPPPRKPGFFQASKPTEQSKNTIEGAQPPGTVVKKNGDGYIILLPYST